MKIVRPRAVEGPGAEEKNAEAVSGTRIGDGNALKSGPEFGLQKLAGIEQPLRIESFFDPLMEPPGFG